jgi:MOSC domain-containing protein YiiM
VSHPVPRLLSVNVGLLEPLSPGSKKRTGIHKHPVGGPVLCDSLGLVGDRIGAPRHHGGPDQAVYLYSAEDYAWWASQLGRDCPPGLFGDNLTITAWWEDPRIGDRVQFGEVLLELSAPRIPCATLAGRMGDVRFVSRFAEARRPGAYARVLTSGAIAPGSEGTVQCGDPHLPTITELFDLWYRTPRDRARLLALAKPPLAVRAREAFLHWATASLP